MKKIVIVSILVLFMLYTIVGLIVKIPLVFNNIFYSIITIFAVYFGMFHTDIGQGIKDKLSENRSKYNSEKGEK